MSDKNTTALYDRIGRHYATTRDSEPSIARLIRNAVVPNVRVAVW